MSDEKDKTPISESLGVVAGSAARMTDPRPTDLEIFFQLLPSVIGGLAGKNDIRSTNSTAFVLVREALGQCAVMGTLRAGFVCLDGSLLASMPNNQAPIGVQQPVSQVQGSGNGYPVAQYPNTPTYGQQQQPGAGGVVSQYPTYQGGGGPGAAPGQQPNYGGGSRGVMVAQFPNGTQPPQL
jgi:hypothetical protein